MIRKIGVIFLAVMFLGSMAVMPVIDSVHAADKAASCDCGKDCKCDHCKTGKGECSCKTGAKGAKGCSCKVDGKGGCQCGKDCQCEHCKTGKGTCSCKGDGKGGCSCGKGCSCGHCDADHKGMKGKHGKHGKGCSCGTDAKGGCQCGKDCQCEHCKTGKGTCSCKGDGKGGCSCGKGCGCGHCDADHKGMKGKHGKHGKGCSCGTDAKGGCHCGKDCQCEHCKTGKGTCSCKGDGKGGCKCGKGCGCGHCAGGEDAANVKAPTADADYAKTMMSKAGTFKASYTSEAEALPVNKIMSWKLKVETPDGKPVKDAEVMVEGAMPEHGHGFPTEPKVTKNNGDGTYQVEGIKFSMTGWWTVTFTIKSGGKTDTVTFNLQLK